MRITNFAVLEGSGVQTKDGKIAFKYEKHEAGGKNDENYARAVIRTDSNFSNGKVKLIFKTDTSKLGLQIRLKVQEDEKYIYAGHAYNDEEFILARGSKEGFTSSEETSVGSLSNYDLTKNHEMVLEVDGSNIRLFIDNVFINQMVAEIKESPIEIKIVTSGVFECSEVSVEKKTKKAFVVMQFSREYDELYEEVIKPVCSEFDIIPLRADEYYSSTPIISDIIRSIKESALVIADITPDNPNVFYEIGYSHAVNKPVILLSDKKREKLPFDISSFRTIFYENTIAGKKKVEQSLRKYLLGLL